jgi:pimeloyl-ACP methyl ester carboxylesterase
VKQEWVRSGEVRLNVVDWRSDGTRQALLCLHGITANARAFDGIGRELAPEIGVVAFDLRGRGESDKPAGPYGLEAYAGDAIAVMDALGLERVVVVGWSLGALIGMQLAASHPERVTRLLLLDPPLAPLSEQASESLGRFQSRLGRTYASVDAAVDAVRAHGVLGSWSDAVEAYVRADLEELPDGRVGHRMRLDVLEQERGGRIPPLTAIVPKIVCPVLILRATDTLFQPGDEVLTAATAEQAARVFVNADWLDIPGTNHYTIAVGYPAGTIAAIRGFVGAE